MYLEHFQLREAPFSIAPDPAYLFLSARHQEALGHLLYGTGTQGGFVQLTGEVGTGKTTLVRALLREKLDDVDVAMIYNPRQNEVEFLASICDELGVAYPTTPAPSIKTLVDVLNAHLLATHARGRRVVLVIDEAQNLPVAVLEQVRLLTNLETDKEKLLRIMLVGQPELAELLDRPDLRQLASRITARYHLMPLSLADTRTYLAHRARVAGALRPLFTREAEKVIYRRSGGIPRQINILADRALLGAYAVGDLQVSAATARRAADEVLGGPARPRRRRFRLSRIPLLAWAEGLLAAVGLLIALLLLLRSFWPEHTTRFVARLPAPVAAASSLPPASESVAALPPLDAPSAATTATPAETASAVVADSAQPTTAAGSADAPVEAGPGALAALLGQHEPLGRVMVRLLALWQPDAQLPASGPVCPALAKWKLECLHGQGDWSDLEHLDLPAILTLHRQDGTPRYVVLRHLDGQAADLATQDGDIRFSRDRLNTVWSGEYLAVWRNPVGLHPFGVGTRGDAVLWLRRALDTAEGHRSSSSPSPTFDDALKQRLMHFQRTHQLTPDGLVGTQTLIALIHAGAHPGPLLMPGGEGADKGNAAENPP